MKKNIVFITLTILLFACKKTDLTVQTEKEDASSAFSKQGGNNSPEVITSAAKYVIFLSAQSGGSVSTSGGGNSVTERGVCVSTSHNPTIADMKFPSGSGPGTFTVYINGLSSNTIYYSRAYATKTTGTTYGNEIRFTTPSPNYGTVTDADGNVYTTLQIGWQTWTIENLKTTHYRDGTPIPNVTDNMDWFNLTSGAYCNYDNNGSNADTYGRLYNWYAVNDARNLAPAGWHVPSQTEWDALITTTGGCSVGGIKLKDNTLWDGDNSSGFKALPAGRRYSGHDINGNPVTFFSALNSSGDWWTSTIYDQPNYIQLGSGNSGCGHTGLLDLPNNKRTGYSIRLVKD